MTLIKNKQLATPSAGVTDHGALTGLDGDDHTQYALADGTRGSFATTAQGSLADSATQPGDDADTLGSGTATDGQVLTADGAGGAAWEDPALPNIDGGTFAMAAGDYPTNADVDGGTF